MRELASLLCVAIILILNVFIYENKNSSYYVDYNPSYTANCENVNYRTEYSPPVYTGQQLSYNAFCYLSIPSVQLSVPCYYSIGGKDAQDIVDAENSACIMPCNGTTLIGDHCDQGFEAIKGCQIGDEMYLTNANGTNTYRCVGIDYNAMNVGDDCIYNANGTPIYYDSDGIICYTCNANYPSITCVYFTPCY